jgi:hypothetical protein
MPKSLPADAGVHRWVWDLRYTTPTATHYEYPISAVPHDTPRTPQGPLALPGTYKVRLTAAGKVVTAPLTIKMDPRVEATQSDLTSLFTLESQLAEMVSNSSRASLEAHSIREQIEKLSKNAQPPLKGTLEGLDKDLAVILNGADKSATDEEKPGLDTLAGEAGSLYSQVGQADAPPTAAQQHAADHASEELSGVLQKWEQWKGSSITETNIKLRAAHLPELKLEQKPQTMPEGGDED